MARSGVRWVLGRWLGGLSLLPLSIGCAGQSEDTKRQLVSMNERLVVLQNDRDRLMERVDALESRFPSAVVRQDEAATPHVAPTRPPLKIVRLEPAPEGLAPDAAAEREASSVDSPVAPPAPTTVNEVSHEPQVVLYGEGTTSGVRSSTEGANHR